MTDSEHQIWSGADAHNMSMAAHNLHMAKVSLKNFSSEETMEKQITVERYLADANDYMDGIKV